MDIGDLALARRLDDLGFLRGGGGTTRSSSAMQMFSGGLGRLLVANFDEGVTAEASFAGLIRVPGKLCEADSTTVREAMFAGDYR